VLRWLPLLSLLLTACPAGPASSGSAAAPSDSAAPPLDSSALRVRGLAAPWAFADSLPALYRLLAGDALLRADLEAYASQLARKEGLAGEADFRRLFETRDKLADRLGPVFESQGGDLSPEAYDALEKELNRIGLSQITAEGQVLGVTLHPLLQAEMEAACGKPFVAYMRFRHADAASMSGEYPYLDLKPYQDMARSGWELIQLKDQLYFPKIEDRYYRAVEAITDVHMVVNPEAGSRSVGTMIVGGVNTDAYPGATDFKARQQVARDTQEPLAQAMRKILQNPSEISETPEAIYLIVTEWQEEAAAARRKVNGYLVQGVDVPHYLKIRRGNGRDHYAITYRFFENEEKANAAMELAKKQFPDAELIYVSVRGEDLYEMGG
jgi:hypothetical protein